MIPYVFASLSSDALIGLGIQAALAIFSAGMLYANVRALGKEVEEQKKELKETVRRVETVENDVVGLKVHTNYRG